MATFPLATRNAQLDAENARTFARIALETQDERDGKILSRLGDEKQLRGLPAISRGVTGAIDCTVPGWNLR